jgi:hypothetical protein
MPSDIGEIDDALGDIIIYPNPNNGLFKITVDDFNQEDLLVKIINNQGQIVYNREFNASGLEYESIDVQQLPQGIYHIVIYTEEKAYQGKMIIQ